MVRRWSYINSINALSTTQGNPLLQVVSGLNVNATRYFYWKTFSFTKVTRVQWARRKHLTQWIFFTNVLFTWTSEYSFHRRHANYTRTINLFKYNYNSFNFMLLKYLPLATIKNSEEWVSSSWYPQLTSFYKGQSYQATLAMTQINYFTRSFVSSPTKITENSSSLTSLDLGTIWLSSNEGTMSIVPNNKDTAIQSYLTTLVSQTHLCYLVNYYQLVIYLYLKMLSAFVSSKKNHYIKCFS